MFFDLGLIPNDAVINSATLKLFVVNQATSGSKTIQIHKATSAWTESTTWDTAPSFNGAASVTFQTGTTGGTTLNIDVKSLIQEWVNGTPNFGMTFTIQSEPSETEAVNFATKDTTTVSQRPTLSINYTIPTTGKKQVEYVGSGGNTYSNSTAISPSLPSGIQAGDLLVVQLINNLSGDYRYTAPSGWTFLNNHYDGRMKAFAYKFATSNETTPTFGMTSGTSAAIGAAIYAFRNVKNIKLNQYADHVNVQTFRPSESTISVNADDTMFAIFNIGTGGAGFTAPLGYSEVHDSGNNYYTQAMIRYMYNDRDQTPNEMQATVGGGGYSTGFSQLLVLEPIVNSVPSDPTGVTVDKSACECGDTITITVTGAADPDGDSLTYDADIYDGVGTWINIATGMTTSTFPATVPPMVDTTGARVRVRAVDSKGEPSGYAQSTTFTVRQKDGVILAPVNVVSSTYLTYAMGRPVQLSNGWLIGVAYDMTNQKYYVYKSETKGKTWQQLTFFFPNASNYDRNFSVVSKGNWVYIGYTWSGGGTMDIIAFDATTVTNTDITATRVKVDDNQADTEHRQIAISPDGNTLWWAHNSKNTTYNQSFNVRCGSVPINVNGTLGTPGVAEQVTTFHNSAIQADGISLVMDGNVPVIAIGLQGFNWTNTGNSYHNVSILRRDNKLETSTFLRSTWTKKMIYFAGGNYIQQMPQMIRTPNGKYHIVWYGQTAGATEPTVRYVNSADTITWGTTKVLAAVGTNPSISSDKDGKLFVSYDGQGGLKRLESTDDFTTFTETLIGSGNYPAMLHDPTYKAKFVIPPTIYRGNGVKYYGHLNINEAPSITVTSPSSNVTLTEGSSLLIEGYTTDVNEDNVVTAKFRVNGGTTRAMQPGLSDGSTPIYFAKTLTYSNKRIYDGTIDIVGFDLSEGVDHTLTIWSEDDKGGKSAEVTRKFRVVWNRPPVISGTNENLGVLNSPPTKTYSIREPEGDSFTVTEKINGAVIRSFPGVPNQDYSITIPHDFWIRLDLDTPHSLTVEATDSKGLISTRTYTFTRTETHIEFILNFDNPDVLAHFTCDAMPERVLVTLERYIPEGAEIESVKVCNNAFDQTPTWEDATGAVRGGRGYLFQNTTKTAADWGINIWVVLAKGTATERVRLNGYGGAFD